MPRRIPKLRLGLIQTNVRSPRDQHLEKTRRMIRDAARRGVDVVCLEELFATPYFAQTEDPEFRELAEPIPGPLSSYLADCARACRVTLVGGSIYERADDGKLYNTTLVHDAQGNLIGKYRKVHIPQDPQYYEQFYFAPGNLGYVQVPLEKAVIAPLICYDQWYPEAARANVLQGAQLLVYPTAIGWFPQLRKEEPFSARRWEHAMRAHASMNGVFVAAINRVGREGNMTFWGGSFVADPFGEIVARASSRKEEVLMVNLDLRLITASQEGWRFLQNRRPESYRSLTQ